MLKTLAILIVVIVLAIILSRYFGIESMTAEQMRFHQFSEGPDTPITFYVRSDRFNADKNFNPTLVSNLQSTTDLKCGPQIDWSTYMQPGANNVYGDMIWSHTSPKMVLEDNSFNCKTRSFNGPDPVLTN